MELSFDEDSEKPPLEDANRPVATTTDEETHGIEQKRTEDLLNGRSSSVSVESVCGCGDIGVGYLTRHNKVKNTSQFISGLKETDSAGVNLSKNKDKLSRGDKGLPAGLNPQCGTSGDAVESPAKSCPDPDASDRLETKKPQQDTENKRINSTDPKHSGKCCIKYTETVYPKLSGYVGIPVDSSDSHNVVSECSGDDRDANVS